MESPLHVKRQMLSQLRTKYKESSPAITRADSETHRFSLPDLNLNSPRELKKEFISSRIYSRDVSYIKDRRLSLKGALRATEEELFVTLAPHLAHAEKEVNIRIIPVKDAPRQIEQQFYEVIMELVSTDTGSDEGLHAYKKYSTAVKNTLEILYNKKCEGPSLSYCANKSIRPTGRREAELLANWLINMMKHYITQCELPVYQKIHAAELILKSALKEIMRQITVQCIERGELLGKIIRAMGIVSNMTAARDKLEITELESRIEKTAQENEAALKTVKEKRKDKISRLKCLLNIKSKETQELRKSTQEYLSELNVYRKRASLLQVELEDYNKRFYLPSQFERNPEKPIAIKRHATTLTEAKDFKTKTRYRKIFSPPLGKPLILVGYFEDLNVFQKLAAYASTKEKTHIIPYDFPINLIKLPEKADVAMNTVTSPDEMREKAYVEVSENVYREINIEDIIHYENTVPLTMIATILYAKTGTGRTEVETQTQERIQLKLADQSSIEIAPTERQRSKEKSKRRPRPRGATVKIPEFQRNLQTDRKYEHIIPAIKPKKQGITHSISIPLRQAQTPLRTSAGLLDARANTVILARASSLPRPQTPPHYYKNNQNNTEEENSMAPRKPIDTASYIQSICSEDSVSQLRALKEQMIAQNINFTTETLSSEHIAGTYRRLDTMQEVDTEQTISEISSFSREKPTGTTDKAVQVNLLPKIANELQRTQTTINSRIDNVPSLPVKLLARLKTDICDIDINRNPMSSRQRSPGILFLKNYLAYLSSNTIFHSPITLKQLMKIINKVYSDKLSANKEGFRGTISHASGILYNVLLKQYGLRSVAEQKLRHVVLGCLAYSGQFTRISNFERFLGITEEFSLEKWNFYGHFLEGTLCSLSGSILLNKDTAAKHFIVYHRAIGFVERFFRKKLAVVEYDALVLSVSALKQDDDSLFLSKKVAVEKVDSDDLFYLLIQYYDGLKEKAFDFISKLTSDKWKREQSISLGEIKEILFSLDIVNETLIDQHFSEYTTLTESDSIPFESVLSFVVENSLINYSKK